MNDQDWLARRFEEDRRRLYAVAYRMLGSASEAEDAVQETWLRLSGSDPEEIENLSAWLTTVVSRVALNFLRSRKRRREEPMRPQFPDLILDPVGGVDPEHEALLGDAVGLALLIVLDTLSPAERIAFVLHDMFGVPFDDIAPIVGRSPQAARQLASRARRRVRAQPTSSDVDVDAQYALVQAFLTASRSGDFAALLATLDPDIVLRADGGRALPGLSKEVRGAEAVARQAGLFARIDLDVHPVLVNGAAGMLVLRNGVPFSVATLVVRNGRIAEMDFLADPERLAALDLAVVGAEER
jgi:RNA polymerase sigma-70 factor (ECF subfamily)